MINLTIVLGVQFGDEGKGKIVDFFTQSALCKNKHENGDHQSDKVYVCRFNGGNNAGHTVLNKIGERVKFHSIPSGFLQENAACLIGAGCLLNLELFYKELKCVAKQAPCSISDAFKRVFISKKVHLIFAEHIAEENLFGTTKRLGTTGQGIGVAYRNKISRDGVRLGDFIKTEGGMASIKSIFGEHFQLFLDQCKNDSELQKLVNKNNKGAEIAVIVEGANAVMLDIDHGTYPYVTSSSCMPGNVFCSLAGILPLVNKNIRVFGVCKPYLTRSGEGPFPTEFLKSGIENEIYEYILGMGKEYGTTTGRARRCGWLDLPMLRYACQISSVEKLIVNKIDMFYKGCVPGGKIKVATSYKMASGNVVEDWNCDVRQEDIVNVNYIELDAASSDDRVDGRVFISKFLETIQKHLNVPIFAVGTGELSNDFVEVTDLFQK